MTATALRREKGAPITKAWIESRVEPDTNGGCWLWTGFLTANGYGALFDGSNLRRAHRTAWELYCGPAPAGTDVCHKCDVRTCVNPAHLFLGSRSDNMRDCVAKGRANKPRGADASRSRLSADQVLEIRRRLEAGEGQRALGREYGVAGGSIQKIASGQSWSWLAKSEAK